MKTENSKIKKYKNADIYTVSKPLGHASIKTIEKYYVDLISDNYKVDLDGLDDIINYHTKG